MNSFGSMDEYLESQGVSYVELPPVPEILPMDSDIESLQKKLNAEYGNVSKLTGEIESLQEKIADLENRLVGMTDLKEKWYNSNQSAINTAYTRENAVKSWLIEQVSDNDLKREPAEALAEIMGFEATRTVAVTGTVSFTGELEVSIFEPNQDFSQYDAEINYFDVAINGEDIVNLDYAVEDLDVDLY